MGPPRTVSFYSANVTGVVVPFQQNKPVVSNNVTNTCNATGIIHPSGGSKHTSPIATGGTIAMELPDPMAKSFQRKQSHQQRDSQRQQQNK